MKLYVKENNGEYAPATPTQVLSAIPTAANMKYRRGTVFDSPGVAKEFFTAQLAGHDSEVFAVAFLDNRHRLIKFEKLFFGTINAASVYPREVVKRALELNSAAVVLAHNHPSGDSGASNSDKQLTERLKAALQLIDVRILDHVIVGDGCLSFAEHGLL